MITYVVIVLVIVAILTFMVWGDDGPFWKNFLLQAWVGLLIAAVIGAIVWVGGYGT